MTSALRSKGALFILSSPSGAGKSSLARALTQSDNNLQLSISATTRLPRPDEIDGMHYHFYSLDKFNDLARNQKFIEYNTIYGNQYGTPKQAVIDILGQKQDVLFDVDTQGMVSIKVSNLAQVVSIFVLPPSLAELESRLQRRAQDTADVVARRLQMAKSEISLAPLYDYVIVNEKFDDALEQIQSIISAERHKKQYLDLLDSAIKSF